MVWAVTLVELARSSLAGSRLFEPQRPGGAPDRWLRGVSDRMFVWMAETSQRPGAGPPMFFNAALIVRSRSIGVVD